MAENKKTRKPNFSHAEIIVFLEEYLEAKELLMSSLRSDITNKKKAAAWRAIVHKVSAEGVAIRNVQDLKEKWRQLRGDAIKRRNGLSKTGGGKPDKPSPYDEMVFNILGETSVLVHGIDGKLQKI